MKNTVLLKGFFPLFNVLILVLYISDYDITSSLLLKFVYLVLFVSILGLISIKLSGRIFQYLQDMQIVLFSVILLFLVLEVVAWLSPNLIPIQIRNYIVTSDLDKAQKQMVDYLDESPFVKFNPNTMIKSQGYRGNNQQFIYEWKTDNNGFKNLDVVSNKKTVDIVAVGDSFTEGMGVATQYTWASILTKNGYSTYNLGVQGYAPIQLEGSFRKYGLKLKPKYVIIGYCATTFEREKMFFDANKAIKDKQFTGGVQSIIDAELRREIKLQVKYIVSASYMLASSVIRKIIRSKNSRPGIEIKNRTFKDYKSEIAGVGSRVSAMNKIEKESKEWRSMLLAFSNIIKMANSINAKVIFLYLPHRGHIYYKAATGKKLPDRYFEKIEASLLREYAEINNISFLDPSERLKNNVENISKNDGISELPYLVIDGHMSNTGHQLVAEEILEFIRKGKMSK